jgi:protein SCO1/2
MIRFKPTSRSKTFKILLLFSCLIPVALASTSTLAAQKVAARKIADGYVCPMDADVKSATPGKCPKCGMALESASAGSGQIAQASARESQIRAPKIPDVPVIDQNGRKLRFYGDLLKGKTVMINFAFTTCAGVCPPMTANLAKVQEYLGERIGKEINMITITVDPAVDTPQELKKYAEKFKAGPGWYFLTGKKENIDAILSKLGGYVEDKLKHSSVLLIGNIETGEWMKMMAMAKPSQIADAVLKVASLGKQ